MAHLSAVPTAKSVQNAVISLFERQADPNHAAAVALGWADCWRQAQQPTLASAIRSAVYERWPTSK